MKMSPQNVKLRIRSVNLSQVSSHTFLGVKIDSELNWKEHIETIHSKLCQVGGIFHRVRKLIDNKSAKMLYCCLFLPHLSYCAEVWGNTYETSLKKVITAQKRIVRVMNCDELLAHTSPIFQANRLLKFVDITITITITITILLSIKHF